MAHGVIKRDGKGIGSRRIFAPQFKLQVLDSYRNDVDCKGNQRATARKYGIHRRQIQKWLQVEQNLRNSVLKQVSNVALRQHRQQDDSGVTEQRVPYIPTSPVATVCTSPQHISPSSSFYSPDSHVRDTALDFTTHTLNTYYDDTYMYDNLPPCCPIDLSVRKASTPTPYLSPTIYNYNYVQPNIPPELDRLRKDSEYEIWDLSMKKQVEVQPKKPKLFKPYLLDDEEYCSSKESSSGSTSSEFKQEEDSKYVWYSYEDRMNESYFSPVAYKQRQSYSVNFKLSAIEPYYNDDTCRVYLKDSNEQMLPLSTRYFEDRSKSG